MPYKKEAVIRIEVRVFRRQRTEHTSTLNDDVRSTELLSHQSRNHKPLPPNPPKSSDLTKSLLKEIDKAICSNQASYLEPMAVTRGSKLRSKVATVNHPIETKCADCHRVRPVDSRRPKNNLKNWWRTWH